jgi:hypothetical protein
MINETFEEIALADDLTAYVNDKHTQEECIGFIDGYKAALAKLKNLRLGDVVGRSEQLPQPDCHFYDEEHQKWIWAYSKELIDSLR